MDLPAMLKDATHDELLKLRALADFLLKESTPAPVEAEYAYQALAERLDTTPPPFHQFCRNYLYNKMLANLKEIEPFIKTMGLNEAPHEQFRFWRLAAHLLESNLKANNKEVTLITLVSYLYKVPALFNKAYPSINSPVVRNQILKSR